MTFQYVNMKSLKENHVSQQPFPWCMYEDLINREQQTELVNLYPENGFEQAARLEGSKKNYRFNVLPLIHKNVEGPNYHQLNQAWKVFIQELSNREYLNLLLNSYGIKERDYKIDIGLFRFKKGDWVEPHVDHEDKLLTQLFYFNDMWEDKWGGLLLLQEEKEYDKIFAYFTPSIRHSIAFKRTHNAWHSVTALTENSQKERLTLQLEIWKADV